MDGSPPGSSVHGVFQARVLEWVPLPSPVTMAVTTKTGKQGSVWCKCDYSKSPVEQDHMGLRGGALPQVLH